MDILTQLRAGKLAGATRLDLQCGLVEFPREIFDLADSLEILNLTGNRLHMLPDDLGRLKKLRIVFCSENEFTHLPPVLGDCPQLSMVGFKSNRIAMVDPASLPISLRWLILTDNHIRELPSTLARCTGLQKLMLSGNRLSALPEEMVACMDLEMVRLAANQFEALPSLLLELPKLSWLALAGNPCAARSHAGSQPMTQVPWSALQLQDKLGEGASGEIYRALWQSGDRSDVQPVAVKLFKGAVTSDGLPSCEMDACIAVGSHEHLIPVKGRLTDHPSGTEGLIMSLIDPSYVTLAGPPDLHSCTRDIYLKHTRFPLAIALPLALGIASAARQLHAHGILHGDLYAHNVLWNPQGHSLLGDFGAASFYDPCESEHALALQRIEVRAFGCLLEELIERIDWAPDQQQTGQALRDLQARCTSAEIHVRPAFETITQELREMFEMV